MHLQAADDLLLCIQEADQQALLSQQEYYGGSNKVDSSRFGKRGEDYAAGMSVYDIKDPANPRQIGFMEVEGLGLHRIWWAGGRYAYASALLDGYTDHILIVIDMADPTKPHEVGRWWIPGMNAAAGEIADLDRPLRAAPRDRGGRLRLRLLARRRADHPGCEGQVGAETDRPSQLVPAVRRRHAQRGAAARSQSAGGGRRGDAEHRPGADQAHLGVRHPREEQSGFASPRCRRPSDQDYVKMGGQFGPHNLHENRPGSFRVLHHDLRHLAERGRARVRHHRSVPAGGDRLFRPAAADELDGADARPGEDAAHRGSVRGRRTG